MASKQLGKLRQWGREVISSKEKTVVTEEFKELEQDIDLRRAGIEKLHGACTEYHGYLHKKKEYANVEEGVKMLPVDALGAVMMAHGDEFGDDSAFGQCLLKFGRAHCKIATLQETYALAFRDTYLANLEGALAELSDYSTQRKKLDSRRLAYDAAMTKAAKAKKDKEVKEAEEELSKAKLRYEETSTDVQSRMHAIQEKELQQLRDLTEFLTTEVRFAEQYLDVLRDTQDGWLDESAIASFNTPRPSAAAPHTFAFGRSTPSIASTSRTAPSARPASTSPSDDGDHGGFTVTRRVPSRPSSRNSNTSVGTATSRRRRDSVGSEGKRGGVAGWASSAVSSLAGRKDKAGKDKDAGRAFASLENDGEESSDDDEPGPGPSLARSFGSSALGKHTPPAPASSSSSFNSFSGSGSGSSEPRRAGVVVVRALHDFAGEDGDGELSFRAGDAITVLGEAAGGSGWARGELGGRRGLFPASYTEPVASAAPPHPKPASSLAQRAREQAVSVSVSEDDASVSDVHVYDEPFGDHHLAKSPMDLEHEHEPSHEDEEEEEDEDEMKSLFPPLSPPTTHGLAIGNAAGNSLVSVSSSSGASARPPPPALPQRKLEPRKAPPPPPARRSTVSASATPTLATSTASSASVGAFPSANSASVGAFPPPPAAPKRPNPRARSTTALPVPAGPSPFGN